MPSAREFRRRIRSVRNTSQITKAMEMVSAVKMRRAQEAVGASRPYAQRMAELVAGLARVASQVDEVDPLLAERPVQRIGLIVITGDRGLCGAFNTNVIRRAAQFIVNQPVPVQTMAIGRKGRDWLIRHGSEVIAEVSGLPDRPSLLDIAPITTIAIDGYRSGRFDRVEIIYNRFVSTLRQETEQRQILPVVPIDGMESRFIDYIFEPDPITVLAQLLPRYVEVLVYQSVLESVASEHSARMVAMHNATQNAREVIEELTLSYNKARQAGITKEILEIAAGAEALRR
ncbi:MAG: ATP synthase F1 subunit gamma [Chloroflexi bacterium]|jgi:F-type H+-transporting ATPase subunit gamma|nr:ATP synthase F1 subunit gamma [Chloroflexota bacterium]HLG51880.1 ATP synthase F1 subunit gamma [Chloroflexota bacterium]